MGVQLFRRLAATADVVLETFRPGFLASLGLGYELLREAKRPADPVFADTVRPDRALAGLCFYRSAAYGCGRRDGVLRLR